MIRRPPRSTLFPTRRSSDLSTMVTMLNSPGPENCSSRKSCTKPSCRRNNSCVIRTLPRISRSEEHTSELQSRENLVCRLLLEKKKKKIKNTHSKLEHNTATH